MKAITQKWLNYAKADLMNCEQIKNNVFLTNIVAFHSQQTVEKYFKGIIEEKGLKLERVHNLFKLHSLIETPITYEVDLDQLELLDKVYTTSRYPDDLGLMPEGKPTIEQAVQFYEFAKYIYEKTLEAIEN
jgi:HEPN domain-containing protein